METKISYVREELKNDFNQSPTLIVEKLKKKGIDISTKTVSQEKWVQNKKSQKVQNSFTLASCVINILNQNSKTLTEKQLFTEVKRAGYKSNSADFFTVFKKALYKMAVKGIIQKVGTGQYSSIAEKTLIPVGSSNLINPDILSEVLLFVKQIGGIYELDKYIAVLSNLEKL